MKMTWINVKLFTLKHDGKWNIFESLKSPPPSISTVAKFCKKKLLLWVRVYMENFENLIPQAPLSLLLDPPPSSILCQQRTAAATLIVFIKHFLLWTNEELGTILLQNLTAHTSSRTFWVWSFEEREHDGRVKGTVIKFIRNSLFFFQHTPPFLERTDTRWWWWRFICWCWWLFLKNIHVPHHTQLNS